MAQDQFIALGWKSGEVSGAGTTALVRSKSGLEREGWRLVYERPGLWIFGIGAAAIRVVPLGVHGGVVIGDLFDAEGELIDCAVSPDGDHGDPGVLADWLCRHYWGRYLALSPEPRSDRWGAFRDPLGGLEVLAWRYGDVTVATSCLPEPVLRHLSVGVSIDWRAVCGVVADPPSAQARNLLHGVEGVAPGELAVLGGDVTQRRRIWSPSRIARQSCPDDDLEARLRTTVDLCVRSWAKAYEPLIAEISGGLDSSIVASALASQALDVRGWFNHHIDAWVGDERPYARALADRLGVPLTEVARPPLTLRPDAFLEVADGPKPTFNAADVGFDQVMGQAAKSAKAQAIATGQGGDVVFFQMATPEVATDRFRRLGPRGLTWPFLRGVADWNQVSVWAVLRQALWPAGRPMQIARPYLSERARAAARKLPRPVYLADAAGLPPAKRLQVANLAYIQVVRGRSRRGREASVLHPLLSQPLVELCLRIPSDRLVQGGRARGLARDAFADRLPPEVANRRTKGDMTAFYGHAIAAGLDGIRTFLLDGRLVAEGIVLRDVLDQRLTVEHLAQAGGYGEVFDLLAIEAWVRSWEVRLATLSTPEVTGGPMSGERKAKTSAQ